MFNERRCTQHQGRCGGVILSNSRLVDRDGQYVVLRRCTNGCEFSDESFPHLVVEPVLGLPQRFRRFLKTFLPSDRLRAAS